jgi:hypothetical protein
MSCACVSVIDHREERDFESIERVREDAFASYTCFSLNHSSPAFSHCGGERFSECQCFRGLVSAESFQRFNSVLQRFRECFRGLASHACFYLQRGGERDEHAEEGERGGGVLGCCQVFEGRERKAAYTR